MILRGCIKSFSLNLKLNVERLLEIKKIFWFKYSFKFYLLHHFDRRISFTSLSFSDKMVYEPTCSYYDCAYQFRILCHVRRVIHNCFAELSVAQRAFAKSLKDFKFVTIGSTQTDDERKIGWSFFFIIHFKQNICETDERFCNLTLL